MRRALALGCLAAVYLGVSAAPAPAAVAVDPVHDLRYVLKGVNLTVRLVPAEDGSMPAVRRRLWGESVDAICSPQFALRGRPRVVTSTRLWPRGARQLTFTLPRDISKRVAWCLLERDRGEDVSGVNFRAFIRIYADNRGDRRIGQELRRDFLQNAWFQDWLERVKAIVVDDGLIGISTDLRRNGRGRRVARLVCTVVRDSRYWSEAPDHAVYGRDEIRLRSC